MAAVRPRSLLLLLVALSGTAFSQPRFTVSGTVSDSTTSEPLAAATIRLLGTSSGTITNAQGHFTLPLEPGTRTLVFSSLGYRPDTVIIAIAAPRQLDIVLAPTDITMPEVVVTAEDPAIEIIRRAIANKRRWIDQLTSYSFDAFTRQVLMRDTAIASITESLTRGYWRQGDTLREIISQRRQTANVKESFNFASVGRIMNFNDDEIRFAGYTFVGPTAPNALDYYDYKLLRTRSFRGQEIYEIRMIPRTRTIPLFEGTIVIAGESYALAGIDVRPNEAFLLPFVREKSLEYRQQFMLVNDLFWLPSDIRIDASVTIGIIGFSIPRIGFSQTSAITDYSVNTPLPDSIFRKPRLTVDSGSTRPDSAAWASRVAIPLNDREREAYRSLDSTQTLDVQFRPGGAAMTLGLGEGSSAAASLLSLLDFTFNRVEGLHLGAGKEFDSLLTRASFSAGAAYGFSDHRWKYHGGFMLFTSRERTLGAGAEGYRGLSPVPDQGYYGAMFIGLGCLLAKQDYQDYFWTEGYRFRLTAVPSPLVRATLTFTDESEQSEPKRTDYSFIYPSRVYRENPAIEDGMMRSLGLNVRIGNEPVPLDIITSDALELAIEHSSPSLARSSFDFTRYFAVGSIRLPTFSRSSLFPQLIRMRVAAGTSSGDLPPQRHYGVESALCSFSPFGTMHALLPRELTGTRFVSANVEHNFRSIPFLALGIPFLYEHNIELIVHGGAARVWGSSAPGADRVYWEAGCAVSRIFELFRTDFTWRLSAPTRFAFTLGIAQIL